MKALIYSLLLAPAALAQTAPDAKIITFNRGDTEHCRVVAVAGKPMLVTSYGGVSVAVGMPENKGNGEFSVYVAIDQTGAGSSHVVPKEFSAVFSDADHTRFPFFDKGAETRSNLPAQAPAGPGSVSATSNQIDTSIMRGSPPESPAAGRSPSETLKGDNVPGNAGGPPAGEAAGAHVFLEPAKVKQGSQVRGMVYFRKPKGSKLQVGPGDMLAEIDIPIGGILFRF